LGVTISVPLSNYLPVSKSSVEVLASEDAIDSLVVQRESILESALSEVNTLKRQLDSSHRSIESLELGLRLAQEVYELTLEAYEQGATDFLDVQEAEDDREQARYDLLSERFTYLTTLIDLEYALNTELREGTELRSQK
jgi:outer membrane protein TolC